jgi:succinate dehydrogenase / fumarate reductase membrane anchor subunit
MSLRSPLSNAIGLGSAKEGSGHWWAQRVSSVALTVLSLWFLIALATLGDLGYDSVREWMSQPFNAVLLAVLAITIAYHSLLGVQVILEDYIPNKGLRVVIMLVVKFLHVVLGALGVFAILNVAISAGAVVA